MSWFRSALNRAAEAAGAGGRSVAPNLERVKAYAGHVVQRAGDAVAGGAKMVLERAVPGRNLNNFRHAVRRLDEVSLLARGRERQDALARWLAALKELSDDDQGDALAYEAELAHGAQAEGAQGEAAQGEDVPAHIPGVDAPPEAAGAEGEGGGMGGALVEDAEAGGGGGGGGGGREGAGGMGMRGLQSPRVRGGSFGSGPGAASPRARSGEGAPSVGSVLFHDAANPGVPLTFRDVFLCSKALENIVVSFIMDAPSPMEERMLADMFDLCLSGDHQLHSSLLNAISQLSASFSAYSEVKMSRQELLRMASDAVAGLKLDAQLQRLEAEEERIKRLMDEKMESFSFRSLSLSRSSPRPPSPAAAATTAPPAGVPAAAAAAAANDDDGDGEGVAPPDVSELFGSKPAQPRKEEQKEEGEGEGKRQDSKGGSGENKEGEEKAGDEMDNGVDGGEEGGGSLQEQGRSDSLQGSQKYSVDVQSTEVLFSLAAALASVVRRKEQLRHRGDNAAARMMKVERTREFASELANFMDDFESKIAECRQQRQEAVTYRTSKEEEGIGAERAITDELQTLHQRRREIEEQLKEVEDAIAATTRRHIQMQEEKEQFDIASHGLLGSLDAEEEHLSTMQQQHQQDAKTLFGWMGFLEDSWKMQLLYMESKDQTFKQSLADLSSRMRAIAAPHLLVCMDHMRASLTSLGAAVSALAAFDSTPNDDEGGAKLLPESGGERMRAEEKYLQAQTQMKRAVAMADKARAEWEHLNSLPLFPEGSDDPDHRQLAQALQDMESMKLEFLSLPSPTLLYHSHYQHHHQQQQQHHQQQQQQHFTRSHDQQQSSSAFSPSASLPPTYRRSSPSSHWPGAAMAAGMRSFNLGASLSNPLTGSLSSPSSSSRSPRTSDFGRSASASSDGLGRTGSDRTGHQLPRHEGLFGSMLGSAGGDHQQDRPKLSQRMAAAAARAAAVAASAAGNLSSSAAAAAAGVGVGVGGGGGGPAGERDARGSAAAAVAE
ncbi:hypothetical protein CLOP_g13952 [Closterium sp. NIES-67]|nr:hypothetical protein CLOP_g13952 [Closterium sp. NIES-67]